MKSLWFRINLYLIVTLYQRTQAIPGFDWGLIEWMLRSLCDIFAALDSVWISNGGWLILYRQLVPHRAYFTLLCRVKSEKIQWIHGCADPRFPLQLWGWDSNQRMWVICVAAPPEYYVRKRYSLMLHAWTLLLHVMLSSVLGITTFARWIASARRTMSHALWSQHNSGLVFWTHVFTSTQQCLIMCRRKDGKANTWW